MTRHRTDPDDHLATASQAELPAWMASERGDCWRNSGVDERLLCEQPVMGGWTAKNLLAHVAHWDAFFVRSVELALQGRGGQAPDVALDSATRPSGRTAAVAPGCCAE